MTLASFALFAQFEQAIHPNVQIPTLNDLTFFSPFLPLPPFLSSFFLAGFLPPLALSSVAFERTAQAGMAVGTGGSLKVMACGAGRKSETE